MYGDEWLTDVAQKMRDAQANGFAPTPERLTVGDLLSKYGYSRRGSWIESHIRNTLEKLHLRTNPDFANVWVNAVVSLELVPEPADGVDNGDRPDPTLRIGALDAAHNKPLSAKPDQRVTVATTVMQLHDFSQLPVMTSDHAVKGIVSWKSIGARMVLGCKCEFVRDCMDDAQEISTETPLFDAIRVITKNGYALVRDRQAGNIISGIVTASDLSNQFQSLAGPFLLAGEIEGHLRNLVHGKFTAEQLYEASANTPVGKEMNGAEGLTLGEYCHLLSKPEHWNLLELHIDREKFVEQLNEVRIIRNNIMHFKPEGLEEREIRLLQDVAKFFEELVQMGAM